MTELRCSYVSSVSESVRDTRANFRLLNHGRSVENLVTNPNGVDDDDGYINACLVSPMSPPCSSTRRVLSHISDSDTLRNLSLGSAKIDVSSLGLVNETFDASSNGTVVNADFESLPLPEFGDGGTLTMQCAISYRKSTKYRNF